MTATGPRGTTVKNLKLAHKMLVLSAILMGSMLAVALRRREPVVGAQHPDPTARGPHDPETRGAADLHTKLLASIRAQKNAVLAPDDEQSKEFAAASRSLITDVRAALERLKGLTATDRVEGQVGGGRGARQGDRRLPR